MKAIGVLQYRSTGDPDCFIEFDTTTPQASGRDLLVRVLAVSVNPVDTKVRAGITEPLAEPRILGWDVAGVVEAVGADVALFRPGDRVWYAGSITRPGCNSQYHLVDERIVGRMPESLDFEAAAALPLTSITAWEALFDRLGVDPDHDAGRSILIIGGAGGVGSIATRLAKKVAGLTVFATASRTESADWCHRMGADHCINHYHPLPDELSRIGEGEVDFILCLNNTDQHFAGMAEVIRPQGKICTVVSSEGPLDMNLLKNKSVTYAWEFMYTRSMYETADMHRQHELLDEVARLVDNGTVESTMTRSLGPMSAASLRQAHAEVEQGHMIGKLVLSAIE